MNDDDHKECVYCSGPLFCPEEIGGMTAIADVLEDAGYATFLPHRDGLEAYMMKLIDSPINVNVFNSRQLVAKAIFALDVYQIMEVCDYFVFNMNGRVPDEGGVSETAMAYAAGKPIIIYKNDARTAFNGSDNAMVSCLASVTVSQVKLIPGEIKNLADKYGRLGESPYQGDAIPPVMQDTIKLGGKIWKVMEAVLSKKPKAKAGQELIDQIAGVCNDHPRIKI